MAVTTNPAGSDGSAAAAGTQGAAGASPDGGAGTQGTQQQGGQQTETVEYWKNEAKKAFAARDEYKTSFLSTDEGKSLAAKAAEADRLKAEAEKAKGGGQSGAAQQGAQQTQGMQPADVKKLVDDSVNAALAADRKAANEQRMRHEIVATYRHPTVGGVDADLFMPLAEKFIADGTIKVENGKVIGIHKAISEIAEKKPILFGNAKQALEAAKKLAEGNHGAEALNVVHRERGQVSRPLTLTEAMKQPGGKSRYAQAAEKK